jgi:hypothetical protein
MGVRFDVVHRGTVVWMGSMSSLCDLCASATSAFKKITEKKVRQIHSWNALLWTTVILNAEVAEAQRSQREDMEAPIG